MSAHQPAATSLPTRNVKLMVKIVEERLIVERYMSGRKHKVVLQWPLPEGRPVFTAGGGITISDLRVEARSPRP